ncbi:hypothetical protein [Arthrobacter sp. StoSoilB20]|uniref:hypothetical protein n=1 Tax=Arthrobacter sp. StoSoilB20 TaxID=2830995 RepID=UPI001CC5F374|nr:hypothetical protein [Arthrobacter sp. StoSoilB20]BCW57835.1 hypothetical protein StoSoilB20_11820 [Arthrobacter sp. StoSoilB20]
MTADGNALVPVWTLATEPVTVPQLFADETLTSARLTELRTVLAALADSSIATLEIHPRSTMRTRTNGIALNAASPLAQHLTQLAAHTAKSAPPTVNIAATGDVLYRMVVPAKVAAQLGQGLVKPMASTAAAGGVYSALRDSAGIVANATFVPVTGLASTSAVATGATAAAGAATGSAATAGVAVASAGTLTVAAPLVLMAVSVGVSAYADHQRQKAIQKITDLLEQLNDEKLVKEHTSLEACGDAVAAATSVLLDEGELGLSLGLDSAVHAINEAFTTVRTRLRNWEAALDGVDGPIDLEELTKAFPGIDEERGRFRAQLEIARLAIALKRRVLVVQAVDHAQKNPNNLFKSFISKLNKTQKSVDELEARISSILQQLSKLELRRPRGFRVPAFTSGEVDKLLSAAYRLRDLGEGTYAGSQNADVAIEIERDSDGSLTVFAAIAVKP